MSNGLRFWSFWLFQFLVFIPPAVGQGIFSQEALDQDLKDVKVRITAEEAKLAEILKTKEDLNLLWTNLNNDLLATQKEKNDLEETINTYIAKVQAIENQKQSISEAIDELRERLKLRVIGLYKMQRRMSALEYLSEAKSAHDFQRRGYYLDMLSVYDRDVIQALNSKNRRLAEEQLAAEKNQAEQAVVLEKQSKVEEQLAKKQRIVNDLLFQVGVLEQSQGQSLESLKSSAKELEGVLATVMGQAQEIKTSKGKKTIQVAESFIGHGLKGQKGALLYPVDGKIIRNFGQELQPAKIETYGAEVMLKGMEFKAVVGGVVRAVASGKVVFSQVLPMYGNVVILDHGGRYYSLYGKVASSMVRIGDEVHRGDVVAVLGEAEKHGNGGNFYFELRFEGKAINPAEYFEPL